MSLDRPVNSPSVPLAAITTADQYASYTEPPATYTHYEGKMTSRKTAHHIDPQHLTLAENIRLKSLGVPKSWESPLCGAGAGFVSGIVTCPLDVIKTKLQAQGGFTGRRGPNSVSTQQVYKGVVGSARAIIREDGVRGLYRGLGPMLLGYLPTWAVYLTVYEKARQPYFDLCGNWWLARCYASLTAGACSTVLTNPIWVIKTRLMSQSGTSLRQASSDGAKVDWHYTSTWDAARKMYRMEGIRSFYSGLTPAMLGLTHVAVQFPLYEFFKTQFTGYGIGEHPSEDNHTHWLGISAATFLSKTCASTATYPHEVLRTRMQTQKRSYGVASSDGMTQKASTYGLRQTFAHILQSGGWRGFYAGLGTNLIRAVPSAMTTMLTYEFLQSTIHDWKIEGEKVRIAREGNQL